jgi:peroxiredoxin Q/BCP
MARSPKVGAEAPDFELQGTSGSFRLSDHRGERVVLLFYPGDNTPVCTRQFCSYRDDSDEFEQLDATVVGISGQDLDSHEAFSGKHGLNVPLLADTDNAVAKAYGAHQPVIGTKRAVIIIDEQGVVAFRHDHALGLSYLTAREIGAALAALPERV